MNNKINLIYLDSDDQKISDFFNMHVSQIYEIYAYSCDVLICKYLCVFNSDAIYQVLSTLLEKIKPKGQLILGVINIKKLCIDYLHGKLLGSEMLNYMRISGNSTTISDIIEYIETNQKNCQILNIDTTNNYIEYITITKQ
jgi:hypothetical protein